MLDKKPVIVALDFPDANSALDLSARLDQALCRLKVGKELKEMVDYEQNRKAK